MSIGNVLKAAGVAFGAAAAAKLVDRGVDKALDAVGPAVGNSLTVAANALVKGWTDGYGDNYVSRSKGVRVEPYAIIDTRAVRLPFIKDVLVVAQRLFTSYYVMSISVDNNIGGVKISKKLDKFAPDRDLAQATLSFLSNESYQFGLPFVGEAAGLNRYSVESAPAASFESSAVAFSANDKIKDVQNLAVGAMVDVTLTSPEGKTGSIPIMVRLRTIGMDPAAMVPTLALGGEDNSYTARFRRFRVGEIDFRDLVFNQDKIDNYRRASLADKSGYFRKVHSRNNKGLIATLLTGQPSIGDASSIAVITKDTQHEVEDKMGGRFADFATRQGMFEGGLLILLLVVDPDLETVTIYTRDIEDYGTYAIKDVRASASSNSNGELADIMKSYLEGRVPGRL